MTHTRIRTFGWTALIIMLMALAACNRSANDNTLPATATPGIPVGPSDSEATTIAQTVMTLKAAAPTPKPGNLTEATAVPPAVNTEVPPVVATIAPPTTEVAPAVTATALPPVGGAVCPNPYTVKEGDWIYKIARDCKVEPSALVAANPGLNPDRITPGQQLVMPSVGAPAVPPATSQAVACTGAYTVKVNDNLFRLAYNCGLTTERLAAINGIVYPYTIYVGQVIKFP